MKINSIKLWITILMLMIFICPLLVRRHLTYTFSKGDMEKKEVKNNIRLENLELEKINSNIVLTPNQIDEFAVYGKPIVRKTFYKPLSMENGKKYLSNIFDNINPNITESLPFEVGKGECYIVEVEVDHKDDIKQQAHFIYLKEKNLLGNYGDEFLVVSVYQMDQERIKEMFNLLPKKQDYFGNKIEIIKKNGLEFINTKITTNEAYTYIYYQYNDKDKELHGVTSVVNKIITYENGLVYDVGYYIAEPTKESEDKILNSLIEFINVGK